MSLTSRARDMVTSNVYMAQWGVIKPEEATREILNILQPTVWPRRTPLYGTTGTIRRMTPTDRDRGAA